MTSGIYYFAYGSNMNPARMEKRGVVSASREFASLSDHVLQFGIYYAREEREAGAAIIVPEAGSVVEGVLYLTDDDGLGILDGYEFRYFRDPVVVARSDGSTVEAVTYRPKTEEIHEGLLPRREYMDHLLAGRDLLSSDYVAKLEALPLYD